MSVNGTGARSAGALCGRLTFSVSSSVAHLRCRVTDPTVVVRSDPEILGGTPVFVGTRVPFQNLIDYLAGGDSLDEFLHQFPSVTRAQAQAALGLAREALEALVAV
ncbi:MAG: DUF433 domain-containing protein [Polaromonas sp.]|nr:DUF433 domain-containing protein [Gemmatimonadaceae bacterium]